ncbi:MAG TPA: urease accessory protein UreF [Telmatospirillum sp.]|nr:urease accessory protein UreF [Telmatospirillum sp.]
MPDASEAGSTDNIGLLQLMSWLSPGFPVGSYCYSHGLEQAVESGLLGDLAGVTAWISTVLRHGGAWVDSILFLEAHRAVRRDDADRLAYIADLANAWRGTAETALESRAQGLAFVTALQSSWPSQGQDRWLARLPTPPYAIAVAVAAAAAGIEQEAALSAYLHAVTANLVSAAVRLIPLGQTDGQRAIRAMAQVIPEVVLAAGSASLDRLGTACPTVDWASMRHETQYTRLFRS